jgi:PQQ-like domain
LLREPNGFFEGCTLEISMRDTDLALRDSLGRQLWKLSLNTALNSGVPQPYRAMTHDHLILIVAGVNLLAIDTLGTADQPGPRILWQFPLLDAAQFAISANRPLMRPPQQSPFGDLQGTIGPLTRDQVVVVKGTRLMGVPLLTGKPAWTRDLVAPILELFGDDEVVFALSADGASAEVYRALDGVSLGTRSVPGDARERLTFRGRTVITWVDKKEHSRLSCVDVFSGETLWTREFAQESQRTFVENDEISVLEPEGKWTVLGISDGATRHSVSVELATAPMQTYVLRTQNNYLLICHEKPTKPVFPAPQVLPQVVGQQIQVNGMVHGIARATGKRLWSTRIDHQSFDTCQPRDLPILTFVSQTIDRNRPANPDRERQFAITCLDVRTGKIVFDDRQITEAFLGAVEFHVDRAQKQLEIRMPPLAVRVNFTESP